MLVVAGLLVVAGAGAVVVSAGGGEDEAPRRDPAPAAAATGLRLGCEHSVSPTLAEAVAGRDLTVGNLVFVAYRSNERERPRRRGTPERALAWKFPLAMRVDGAATLRVPAERRAEVALAFRPDRRHSTRLRHGDVAVKFTACTSDEAPGSAYTGWAGRILAVRRGCVPLEVVSGDEVQRVSVSLGAGRCPRDA